MRRGRGWGGKEGEERGRGRMDVILAIAYPTFHFDKATGMGMLLY